MYIVYMYMYFNLFKKKIHIVHININSIFLCVSKSEVKKPPRDQYSDVQTNRVQCNIVRYTTVQESSVKYTTEKVSSME